MKGVCLVSGASSKLGTVLCPILASKYDLITVYNEHPPTFSNQDVQILDSFPEPGANDLTPTAFCIQADLRRRDEMRRVVEVALAKYGCIDHLICLVADTKFYGNALSLWRAEEWAEQQLQLNALAPVKLAAALHEACWKHSPQENALRRRSVTNVSSMSAVVVEKSIGQAVYAASKAALNILTMHLALELSDYSVRVNAICPYRFTNDPARTETVAREIQLVLEEGSTGEVRTEPFSRP